MESATRRQLLGLSGLVGVAVVAAVAFSPDAVIQSLAGLVENPAAFLLVIGVVYLVRPFLLWPATALAVVIGYLYGPLIGFPVALAGGVLTATPPYLIGKYARTDVGLFGTVSTSGERVVNAVGETRTVLAARLSPVPGDPISYGSGLSDISPRAFYLGTAIGEIPWAAGGVLTGASLGALSRSSFSLRIELVLLLAGLSLLLLTGPVYSHLRVMESTGVDAD